MKTIQWLVGTGCAMILTGCLTAPLTDLSRPDTAGMTINNDQGSLGARFNKRNEQILLENSAGVVLKGAAYENFTMTLIAEIDPPQVNGISLQATSVSLNDGFAYISYNTAGEGYAGGVDVVWVNSGINPEIISSVVYDSADVHSLCYSEGSLYLAEASSEQGLTSPAVLERMIVENGKLQLKTRERIALNSFAVTAVTVSDKRVFATSGNTGGLHVLSRETLKGEEPIEADDARWVDADDTHVVIVQGMPGRITVYDKGKMNIVGRWPFSGADIPESKSTVRVLGGKALIAAGTGGVQLMNLATGRIVGSVPAPEVKGMSAAQTVVNAADGAGDLIYVSNGSAGIYAVSASSKLEDITDDKDVDLKTLGKLAFNGLESVNHIAFDGHLLVIATGRGGVKIVSVKPKSTFIVQPIITEPSID